MSVQNTTLSWDQLLELAQNNTSARRVRRPGQLPSTAPIPSSLHHLPPDAATINLLLRRLWGVEPIANPLPLDPILSETVQYRAEAAERLSDNREAAIADILKNSGVQALAANGDISAVKDAIEAHLKLLAEYLLNGDKTQLPWGRVGGKENLDPFSAAVGAITLAYVRNRICAPRDMSAGAATAFRSAADKVLTSLY
ncbi:MAG: hypothetical protein F6K28_24440 [Microcoleus sp. SIO2G3]|nr:hypothetical protein [Microcoleus sp. SIO2G3]